MLSASYVDYIIDFLVNDEKFDYRPVIAYSNEKIENINQKIIIRKSNFFDENIYGTKESIPKFPLDFLEGLPILYGKGKVEFIGDKVIVSADIIASSYFLISRYEEIIFRDVRDKYGRYLGRNSIINKSGCIDKPLVDEYSQFLRALLKKCGYNLSKRKGFTNIYLTHDIDIPWRRFTLKTASKRIIKHLLYDRQLLLYPLLNALKLSEKDGCNNFEELLKIDHEAKETLKSKCRSIYFIMSGGSGSAPDSPVYIYDNKFEYLIKKLKLYNSELGYHISFDASDNKEKKKYEIETLSKIINQKINLSRNHYLASKNPEDFDELIDLGVEEDFTMGFPDVSGFRLGTSRAVNWINPNNKQVTKLKLHPLTIMDVTLGGKEYMNFSYSDALDYSKKIIYKTFQNNGEVSLLWHNTSFEPGKNNWLPKMYCELVNYIVNLDKEK